MTGSENIQAGELTEVLGGWCPQEGTNAVSSHTCPVHLFHLAVSKLHPL